MAHDAFMSYSHAADGKLAPALQAALHRFARPWYRRRAVRVFLDTSSLAATSTLEGAIENTLRESRYFILLASPEAAASEWVEKEVRFWLRAKSPETLLLVVTGGRLEWDRQAGAFAWPASDAIPGCLRDAYREEPRFIQLQGLAKSQDLTYHNPLFLDAVVDLSATLRDVPKDEIVGEDVRQHRIVKGWIWAFGTTLVALTALALGAAYQASVERDRALARALASRAEDLLVQRGGRLEKAALLAVEAIRREPSLDTDIALRKVLRLLPKKVAHIGCADGRNVARGVFSPAGGSLATLGSDQVVRVWDNATGAQEAAIQVTDVQDMLFTDEGEHLAILSGGQVAVWAVASAGRSRTLDHSNVTDLALSGDGSLLATTSPAETTLLWGLPSFERWASYQSSPGMQWVALAPGPSELVTWNAEKAEFFRTPGEPGESWKHELEFDIRYEYSPDGAFLSHVSPSWFAARLFDVKLRQQLLFESEHWDVAFSKDSKRFALASPEWHADVYDLPSCGRAGFKFDGGSGSPVQREEVKGRASCRRLASVYHDDSVETVALSEDGRYLGTTSRDGTARVWEVYRGREVLRILEDLEGEVARLAFSDGGRLVTAWGRESCGTWESTGYRQSALLQHEDYVVDVAFSDNGRFAATVSTDGTARVWRIPDGDEVARIAVAGAARPRTVQLDQDGARLLIDSRAYLNVTDQKPVGDVPWPDGVQATAVSADWRVAAHVNAGGEVVIRSLNGQLERARHGKLDGQTKALAISANGCCVAALVGERKIWIWRWESGHAATEFEAELEVQSLHLDGTGERLAAIVGANAASVELRDAQSAVVQSRLRRDGAIRSMDFHPDGRRLVTAGVDGLVEVWDLEEAIVIAQFEHDADATSAAFSPDGKYVLSGGGRGDRVARLWMWRPRDLLQEACARLSRDFTEQEWRQYIGTGRPRAACRLNEDPP